jgi:hypothetical protein
MDIDFSFSEKRISLPSNLLQLYLVDASFELEAVPVEQSGENPPAKMKTFMPEA